MVRAGAFTLMLAFFVCGCRTAENVASTSAAVVTAPAHFVRNKLRGERATTEQTDRTVDESQPVETAPPPPQPAPSQSPRVVTSSPQEKATAPTSRPSAAP